MNNTSSKSFWFLYLLLATTRAASSAADPALNSKLVLHNNSAESRNKLKMQQWPKLEVRNAGYDVQAETSTVNAFILPFIKQPTLPVSRSILLPVMNRYQNESLKSPVYDNLPPRAKRYSSKLRGLIPHAKLNENGLPRAWSNAPVIRQMASRSLDIKAAIGFIIFIPLLICCSAFFFNVLALGAVVIGYNAYDLSTLGRRSMGNRSLREWFAVVDFNKFDLNKVFSLDLFLSPDQSRTLVTMADNLEKALSNYKHSLRSDTPTSSSSRSYLAKPAG